MGFSRRTISAVIRWLREQSGWLLILDNADNLRIIYEALFLQT